MWNRPLHAIIATWIAVGGFTPAAQTAQAPRATQSAPTAPTAGILGTPPAVATARISGRIVSADTGKPLRRVGVMLLQQPAQTSRFAETDEDGRYEFTRLPAGRYSVRPTKDGYVFVAADPFAIGVGVDVSDGETNDRVDLQMRSGGVITGRIADEFGDPVAGVVVAAVRYVFTPSGQRELRDGTAGSFVLPSVTNDRGEYRIFGLKPGSYYVFAEAGVSQPISIAQQIPGRVSGVDVDRNLVATYYAGSSNIDEAQPVRVELGRDTSASFRLNPGRTARLAGAVRDSEGRPVSSAYLALRRVTNTIDWFGRNAIDLSRDGTFAIADVAPGSYILEVRPQPAGSGLRGGSAGEYATVPLTTSGDDITNIEVVTRSGIAISGRVIFEGESAIAQPNLHIYAVEEEDARNLVSYRGGDDGQVAPDGRFNVPSAFGKVLFRTGFLPANVMLKAVRLNGADITNTPYDTTSSESIVGLEVVLVDKQSRIVGRAKNARGDVETNYRLVVYPANLKSGDVAVRFQHNASANGKGQVTISRMPPGDYVGLAVKGIQPGEEWDPELRRRIEERGRRFTLKEDETLEVEFPILE